MNTASDRGVGPAILFVIGSCISLQFGASLAVQIFPHAGPWGVSMLRLLLAGIILWVFARPRFWTWNAGQWRRVVIFGISLGLMNSFFYAAIEHIPLGVAVTIEFLGPLLLAAALSRRGLDLLWVALAAVGLGLLGWDALLGSSHLNPLGVVLALIAGVFWICYILASAKVGQVIPGQGGLAVAFVIGAVAAAPLGAVEAVTIVGDVNLFAVAVGTALLGSLIPYSLELMALRRLPPGVFGILLSLEPAFAASFGWLLLSQGLSPWQVAAVVLVISASMGVTWSQRRAATAATLAATDSDVPGAQREPQGARGTGRKSP